MAHRRTKTHRLICWIAALGAACCVAGQRAAAGEREATASGSRSGERKAERAAGLVPPAEYLEDVALCDCLLPPQVRQLGRNTTYLARRRAMRTTVRECKARHGEYVLDDRADPRAALRIWLPDAEAGDAEAQQNVGYLFERNLDHARAAEWYRRAAEQGLKSAQVSLGHLYERGLGVARDTTAALQWYRRASDLPVAIHLEETPYQITPPTSAPAASLATKPTIHIIEPPSARMRGIEVLHAPAAQTTIIGRATSPHGIFAVLVNGIPASIEPSGLFHSSLGVAPEGGRVCVAAVDRVGERAEIVLPIVPASSGEGSSSVASRSPAMFGAYTALVIANAKYTNLPDLQTPHRDAKAIADMLRERYGFDVHTVLDATMYDILSELNTLRKSLDKDDNLLVYYAGHGQLDQESQQGYWLAVDAELDSDANWIPTSRISSYLQVIPAKQILIISDSCYSGALTRSCIAQIDQGLNDDEREHWYRVMAAKRARLALTSGGLTPVMDSGGGEYSVFNKALIDVLAANDEVLETQRLYRQLAARVAQVALRSGLKQEPECAPIPHTGHEAGDFFFVPRAK